MRRPILLSILFLGFTTQLLFGQSERWVEQYHYLQNQDIDAHSLYTQGGFDLASNRLTNRITGDLLRSRTLTASNADYLKELDDDGSAYLRGEAGGSIWYRSHSDSRIHWHAGFGFSEQIHSGMRNGVAKLVLNGNAPYEDQTLSLGPTWLRYVSSQFIGGGFDIESDKVVFGVVGQLMKISRWQSIDIASGSIYTAPFGTAIDADLTGSYSRSGQAQGRLAGWYGTGGALRLFLVTRPDDGKMMVAMSINELGFMHFSGSRTDQIAMDTVYRGIEVTYLLNGGQAFSNNNLLDSAASVLGVSSSQGSMAQIFPGNAQLSLVQPIGNSLSFHARIKQWFLAIPPEMRLGLRISATDWLKIEPYLVTGGGSRFDTGLGLGVGGSTAQFFLNYGMLESQVSPTNTRSQHLFGKLHIVF